jgi:hypothetical protein
VGSKSHRRAVVFAQSASGNIDLVLVGDDVSMILQPSDSGKPVVQRLETGSTSNGVNQRPSPPKSACTAAASIIAFRGLLRSSEPSITRVEYPPKRSMIAPVVFAQLNFERGKLPQCGSWCRTVLGNGTTF